jgi:hypothetical protein
MFDLAPAYYLGGFLYNIILKSNHTQRTESDSARNVYTHYHSGFLRTVCKCFHTGKKIKLCLLHDRPQGL